jgi:hypothetical protein
MVKISGTTGMQRRRPPETASWPWNFESAVKPVGAHSGIDSTFWVELQRGRRGFL